jgi:hypothetical protein
VEDKDSLVENERGGDGNIHDGKHLGTNLERGNLDSVRDEKGGICNSIEAVENEDSSHDEVSSIFVRVVVRVDTGTGRPEHIGEEHASVGDEEERATTNLLNEERSSGGNDD